MTVCDWDEIHTQHLSYMSQHASVKYSTIKRALSRLGVDERSVNLLMNLCHGHTTIIKHKDGSESVELRKGVRQGWPLLR